MSSNESFISMMAKCPQVTTMGDRTCGSSGNSKFINLPGNIRISLPQWIDLLPDGTPLEKHGVQPDVKFPIKPEYFEGKRDELLKAAVEKLSEEPLSEEPIKGPDIRTVKAEGRASRPSVIEVWPKDGDKDIDPDTEIRIKFDRPLKMFTNFCVSNKLLIYKHLQNQHFFKIGR